MASSDSTRPATQQDSRSPGHEGSRGSRGEANQGAGADEHRHDQPAGNGEGLDTREGDARGGGGLSSDSQRSR